MREKEIKFRGKRLDDGEWVYGFYYKKPSGKNYIYNNQTRLHHEVDPATVGQYTGLKDKHGREIYEGDICNCREYECYGKVAWNDDEAGFYFCISYEDGTFEEERLYDYADALEIIGNIHDNPELLEVAK